MPSTYVIKLCNIPHLRPLQKLFLTFYFNFASTANMDSCAFCCLPVESDCVTLSLKGVKSINILSESRSSGIEVCIIILKRNGKNTKKEVMLLFISLKRCSLIILMKPNSVHKIMFTSTKLEAKM